MPFFGRAGPGDEKQMARQIPKTYKLLLIGDADVGKTSIVVRYVEDNLTSTFPSTIGEAGKLYSII